MTVFPSPDSIAALHEAITLQPSIESTADSITVVLSTDLLEAAYVPPVVDGGLLVGTSAVIVQAWPDEVTGTWQASSTAIPKDVMTFLAAMQMSMGGVRAAAILSQMVEAFTAFKDNPHASLQLFTDGTLHRISEALEGRAVQADIGLTHPAPEALQ